MQLSEFDLNERIVRRVQSPGQCIYCGATGTKLTDEHVIPYALGANSLILENACCEPCQKIIQRYEQEVLKRQLGTFRTLVDAPSRNKRDRPTTVGLHFVEVDSEGRLIRDLGVRTIPIAEAPVMLNLWSSPPPRLLRGDIPVIDEVGHPWCYYEEKAKALCRAVAEETGANHVGVHLGVVNRFHYLRSLAKTAHAYAATELGVDGFDPVLNDLILCRTDDVAQFVGDINMDPPFDEHPAHTLQISLGEPMDGPGKGHLVVRLQLYPLLKSPAHFIVVGRRNQNSDERLGRHAATLS